MTGKQWIVEVTTNEGLSFGAMVNYPIEMFYLPPLNNTQKVTSFLNNELANALRNNSIKEIKLIKNKDYNFAKDDLSRSSYP